MPGNSRLNDCEMTGRMRHNLQLYSDPPNKAVSLGDMVTLAMERLRVLQAVEAAAFRCRTGTVAYKKILEQHLFSLQLPFSIRPTNLNNEPTVTEIEYRLRDVISHYALAIAYSTTEEKRQWFVQQEVNLFQWRLDVEMVQSVEAFLQLNDINYTRLTSEEKAQMADQLDSGTAYCRIRRKQHNDSQEMLMKKVEFFRIPFEDAADLIKARKVFLKRGISFVPFNDVLAIVTAHFKVKLSAKMEHLAQSLSLMEMDSRIALLKEITSLKMCAPVLAPVCSSANNEISIGMLEQMSKTVFPPCMRRAYEELMAKHHLRYGARMQLGLFLKKLGLPLEEALKFWSSSFAPLVDVNKFKQRYAYQIRHMYGMEGKRFDYPAYSCARIMAGTTPGPMDAHGCPFKHCGTARLQQVLKGWGVNPADLFKIMQYVSVNQCDNACSAFFASSLRLPEGVAVAINHPNQYANESRRISASFRPT